MNKIYDCGLKVNKNSNSQNFTKNHKISQKITKFHKISQNFTKFHKYKYGSKSNNV